VGNTGTADSMDSDAEGTGKRGQRRGHRDHTATGACRGRQMAPRPARHYTASPRQLTLEPTGVSVIERAKPPFGTADASSMITSRGAQTRSLGAAAATGSAELSASLTRVVMHRLACSLLVLRAGRRSAEISGLALSCILEEHARSITGAGLVTVAPTTDTRGPRPLSRIVRTSGLAFGTWSVSAVLPPLSH
jgi:hypothetical protein